MTAQELFFDFFFFFFEKDLHHNAVEFILAFVQNFNHFDSQPLETLE